MKIVQTLLALLALGFVLALAGCDSDTGDPGTEQTAEQTTEQTTEEVTESPDEVMQCVVEPDICTRDINECGNPSSCTCPDGFYYSPAMGECLYDLDGADAAAAAADEAAGDDDAEQCVLEPDGICTRDINECGNPSSCTCPEGYAYNASAYKCLLILR